MFDIEKGEEARNELTSQLVKFATGTLSVSPGFHPWVEEHSGRKLEQKLASTFDLEPKVHHLFVAVAEQLKSSGREDSKALLRDVCKLLRTFGDHFEQDRSRAQEYYERLFAANLPERELIHAGEKLVEIYADLRRESDWQTIVAKLESLTTK
jgi:hypothetical protein